MDSDKKTDPSLDEENTAPAEEEHLQEAPADALSRTPEDLDQEAAENQAESEAAISPHPQKKVSPIKTFFRKVNVYFLLFLLLVAVAGAVTVVNYINSQKPAPESSLATQDLTQDALQQLANSDASVGSTSQTLTIQGNAIIAGQTLMRGDLNVAGDFQSGGPIRGPQLTISGSANLGETQVNSLQVANNASIQGSTTLRDLNVAGTSSFGGAMTASQITVTRLIMSGNASLEVPNHISFTGAAPTRTINAVVLGNGGSASVDGSDTAGTVNINTGDTHTPGCMVRINFRQAFTRQPHVTVTPIGAGAGQLQFYVERNATGFSVCTTNVAPGHQAFAFDYFITN